MHSRLRGTRRRNRLRPILAAASLGLLLAACDPDSMLDVGTPDIVPGEVARDPSNLAGLRNGVLFEFARAYTGPAGSNATPGIIGTSGVFSDEQWYSSTLPRMREFDARDISPENLSLLSVFQYLHRARNWAEVAQAAYATSPLAGSADHALMANLAGYTYIFFAENFCSGVPFGHSSLDAGLTYGPGRSTAEMLQLAVDRFREAMAIAQGLETAAGTTQLNLARVGKARALLNMGQRREAAELAAQVLVGFAYLVSYSPNSSGQNNGIWSQINSSRRSSLASREGTLNRGLEYFDPVGTTSSTMTLDPRVPVPSRSVGIGTSIPVFLTGRHATMASPAPLASYVEAQLMVAEDQLAGGANDAYRATLNGLRANLPTLLPTLGITGPLAPLPELADPGSVDGRIRQLYRERALWLHLQAARLGDLRRMMRLYGYQEDEVFPTGTTIFGRPYGTDVTMPIPFQEGSNPLASGVCFHRNP
jgi:starch-binding outer membrane protein, SusD/RagB family